MNVVTQPELGLVKSGGSFNLAVTFRPILVFCSCLLANTKKIFNSPFGLLRKLNERTYFCIEVAKDLIVLIFSKTPWAQNARKKLLLSIK